MLFPPPSERTLSVAHARANLALALAAFALAACLTGMGLAYDWLQNSHPHETPLKALGAAVMLSALVALERASVATTASRTEDPYPTGTAATVQKRARLARGVALFVLVSPVWCVVGLVLLVFVVGNVAR